MKILLSSLFTILVLSTSAQQTLPKLPVDLATYAPKNTLAMGLHSPNLNAPKKDVKQITKILNSGAPDYTTIYNKDGHPAQKQTSYEIGEYYYDKNANKVTVKKIPGGYGWRYEYFYNKQNLLTQIYEYPSGNELEKKTIFYYDEKNNLIKKEDYKNKQVRKGQYDLVLNSTIQWAYDDKNRVIKEFNETYAYNYSYKVEDNKLIISSTKNDEPISTSTYDKKGVLIEFKMLIFGTNTTEYTNVYDAKSNLIMQTSIEKEKNFTTKEAYEIVYTDGSISKPPLSRALSINPKKDNDVFAKIESDFQNGEGFLEKGKLNGPGIFTSFGVSQKGMFKNGELDGFGLVSHPLGTQEAILGIYKNGKLDGYGLKTKAGIVYEAGIYKEGKLIENFAVDYLNDKRSLNCTGDCANGFGMKKENEIYTYSFFKNGVQVGPYFKMQGGKLLGSGAIMPTYSFIEGIADGKFYFGIIKSTQDNAKLFIKDASGAAAGIYNKKGELVKQLEIVNQP